MSMATMYTPKKSWLYAPAKVTQETVMSYLTSRGIPTSLQTTSSSSTKDSHSLCVFSRFFSTQRQYVSCNKGL
jgi:hypothetical protein